MHLRKQAVRNAPEARNKYIRAPINGYVEADSVAEGSANLFCKGPDSDCFRLCGPSSALERESRLGQYVHKWAGLCPNKT